MKTKLKILLAGMAILLVLPFSSCNSNNGDIGPFYGIWVIDNMTVDGEPNDISFDEYSWRFQSSVVMLTEQIGNYEILQHVGTWTYQEDELTLNFGHAHSGELPEALMLSNQGVTEVKVSALTGISMVWVFESPSGERVRYKLRKLE